MIDFINSIDLNVPSFYKNACKKNFIDFSWKNCEEAINRSIFIKNLELLNLQGVKASIKKNSNCWYTSVFDINHVTELLNDKHTFILFDMSCYNRSLNYICYLIDQKFDSSSDVHVYGGMDGSGSFNIHSDIPYNFIIQLEGKCEWTVYAEKIDKRNNNNNGDIKYTPIIECLMEPGDAMFIPAHQAHLSVPISRRLSISIPFYPNSKEVGRGWINL